MLVLSRRRGEKLSIGPDIIVSVERVSADGVVRLGINAPDHLLILRSEIEPNDDRITKRLTSPRDSG